MTTIAGSSAASSADGFKFTACEVPDLKERKLKDAKKKLKKAGCKIGKLKRRDGVAAKSGRVVRQAPKPGKRLAPGAKVNVTLG